MVNLHFSNSILKLDENKIFNLRIWLAIRGFRWISPFCIRRSLFIRFKYLINEAANKDKACEDLSVHVPRRHYVLLFPTCVLKMSLLISSWNVQNFVQLYILQTLHFDLWLKPAWCHVSKHSARLFSCVNTNFWRGYAQRVWHFRHISRENHKAVRGSSLIQQFLKMSADRYAGKVTWKAISKYVMLYLEFEQGNSNIKNTVLIVF